MSDSHRQRQPSAADVTPDGIFHQRRAVMKELGIAAASLSLPLSAQADVLDWLTGGGKKNRQHRHPRRSVSHRNPMRQRHSR